MSEVLMQMVKALKGNMVNGTINYDRKTFGSADEVRAFIGDFNAEQGWLCFTDRVVLLDEVTEELFQKYKLLSAELVKGDQSLHIRQDGKAWQGWFYSFDASQDGFVIEQQFIGTSRIAGQKLRYQTLWAAESLEEPTLQPTVSRFAGFVKGDN